MRAVVRPGSSVMLSLPVRLFQPLFCIAALCSACGGPTQSIPESQPIAHKQRWYWMGSTSYQNHISPSTSENYWLEIDGEQARLKADCNNASAKAATTVEGRLWLNGIATTRIACPAGSSENIYLKQLSQTATTEQRGEVLRVTLTQYGDAMYFARDAAARFSSYRCEGGESLALIAQAQTLHVWLGDQYRQIKSGGDNKLSVQEKGKTIDLEDSGESIAGNCHKMITSK